MGFGVLNKKGESGVVDNEVWRRKTHVTMKLNANIEN